MVVVSLANIPLDPSQPPSHPTQQWKGTGREGEEVFRGRPLRSRIHVSVDCFFLLLSNSALNQLQGENQGSETLTNLPKVTQLESSRLRLEAGYDNLQGLCFPPPPAPCHPPPPASVDVCVLQVPSVPTGQHRREEPTAHF